LNKILLAGGTLAIKHTEGREGFSALGAGIWWGQRVKDMQRASSIRLSLVDAGACGQLVVEQSQGGCSGGVQPQRSADIEELGKGMSRLTTAVA
jgi:hypothetical protein